MPVGPRQAGYLSARGYAAGSLADAMARKGDKDKARRYLLRRSQEAAARALEATARGPSPASLVCNRVLSGDRFQRFAAECRDLTAKMRERGLVK